MVRILTLAAATAIAVTPLAAQETAQQPAQAAPTQATPTQEQVQTAARHYSIIAGALQSEDVETPIKNQLFLCLYSASMRQISESVTQVLADNEQLDPTNAEHVQQVIGAVCGVRPPEGAAAETPPSPGDQPEGR